MWIICWWLTWNIISNFKDKLQLLSTAVLIGVLKCKCTKISNTFLFLFSNTYKMLVIRIGIHKMLVRIANRKDPDQTASEEAVWSGLHCLSRHFWQATSVRNFRTFTIVTLCLLVAKFVVCWRSLQTAWTQIRTDRTSGWSGSKLFDTMIVFLKEFFEKVNFQK